MLKNYLVKIKKRVYLRIGLILSVLFFSCLFAPKHIYAETFDIGPSDTSELINAINLANSTTEPDTINLSLNSTYELTTSNNDNGTYSKSGLPVVTSEIVINGNGSTISRNSVERFRILAVETAGKLTLNNITIKDGFSEHPAYGGGGILNLNGTLIINESIISNNNAESGGGGGIWILSNSTTNIIKTKISNNSVGYSGSGGGLHKRGLGITEVKNSEITENYAQNNGGAIYSNQTGEIILQNTEILNNSAENNGGAIYNYMGTISINNSTLADNKATHIVAGYGYGGAIASESNSNITITNSNITNNTAAKTGGFFFNRGAATISNSCISGNSIIGLFNQGNLIPATNNYWGESTGPIDNNDIAGSIAFIPFNDTCALSPTPSPTPTPTPSPTPEPTKIPVVLLPGLGGSWNTTAMISGGTSGSWKKTPFVKVYDHLKETFLTSAGYTEGDNYFEFYYDWRKPLATLADSFEDYLNNTVPADTKVNLVGHSLGGMVARSYAQKYGLDKIDQIVTTGSPHEGAIKAWQGWSGAEIGDRWSWEWIGLQLYLQIHKSEYISPVKAVRDLAPGLIDLSPIFNFAKNKNNQLISVSNMSSFNSYLAGLKTSLSVDLKTLMTTISGLGQSNDQDTIEWIKLTDRSLADQLLGKWPDGKPESFEYTTEGDLTVLKKSALIEGTAQATVNATHAELVETSSGIQAILAALGITATPLTNTGDIPRNPSLIFFLHSPANIQVTAPDGSQAGEGVATPMSNSIYSAEDKLLVIYSAVAGDYQVKIIGSGNGSYQLEIGQLTKDGETWSSTANNITTGKTDSYQLTFNPDKPLDNPVSKETAETYLKLAKFRLEQLKEDINQQSISLRNKRNQIVYIDQTIRLIDRALTYLKSNNFTLAEQYIQSAVETDYLLREKVSQLSDINAAGEWLIKAFLKTDSQSAKPIAKTLADRQLSTADKLHNQVVGKVKAKISGENETVGEGLSLDEEWLNQARMSSTDNRYAETYIYSLVSRILSNEILGLVK